MRYIKFLTLFLFLSVTFCQGQNPGDVAARTQLDSRYAPFYHGVASGDPLDDRVIIWTRVTPANAGPVIVNWKMASDTGMTNVVQSGSFTTTDSVDYTVKVDVTGLQAGTWYYYQFETNNRFSLVGRTYTAPTGNIDSLRFGIVSCSDYSEGYFNVYGRMVQRNDMHAIIHLGDYIYEGEGSSGDREHEPLAEILVLDDYRARHSQYKLDEDLRCLHQMYPVIAVWDDHETSNNSWSGGADGHDSGDGLWEDRKGYGVKAYYEWMPIRPSDPNNQLRIYRTINYGNLIDLIMLDTRLIGRDEQTTGSGIDDPNRSMLGPDQLGWLASEMRNSSAQWKILGQQVMMAPLEVPFIGPVNPDAWDGYRAERDRVYDSVLTNNVENVVVLTGDIHTFWANDLPLSGYDPATGDNSIGVEFVVASVTKENGGLPAGQQVIQLANQHMKYVNLADHGYIVLDVNQQRAQADYYFIDDIDNPSTYGDSEGPHYFVRNTESHLNDTSSAATPSSASMAAQPSKTPPNLAIGIEDASPELALLGLYPNPTSGDVVVNFYLHSSGAVTMRLLDLNGKEIASKDVGARASGFYYESLSMDNVPAGIYLLSVSTPDGVATRRLVKR